MMDHFSEEHKNRTANFLILYDFITEEMHGFIQDNQDLSELEREWIERMIELFRDRFDAWEFEERDFLEFLYEHNSQELFDIAALAFLHIGYDLPISMAQAKNEVEEKNKQELDSLRCDHLYKRIGQRIKLGMNNRWQGPYNIPFILLRLLDIQGAVFHWVLHHRQGAWSNYINIRDSNNNEMPMVVSGIRSNMFDNLKNAIGTKKTAWGRALELDVPSALSVAASVAGAVVAGNIAISAFQSSFTVAILVETILSGIPLFGIGGGIVVATALQLLRKRELNRKLEKLEGNDPEI